ncbi:hypothetical protein J6590_041311 [Homalodisca vitripennis]|nr:hypothetical protein J6590_041311 [Homalodisca vitripennis]
MFGNNTLSSVVSTELSKITYLEGVLLTINSYTAKVNRQYAVAGSADKLWSCTEPALPLILFSKNLACDVVVSTELSKITYLEGVLLTINSYTAKVNRQYAVAGSADKLWSCTEPALPLILFSKNLACDVVVSTELSKITYLEGVLLTINSYTAKVNRQYAVTGSADVWE